jgi:hypothetical protein
MRTHLRPDGTPMPFNEVQLPIGQLSINQPLTPEPPRTGSPSPAPPDFQTAALLLAQQNLIQQNNQNIMQQQNNQNGNPDATLETVAAIFSATASGSITPQMMLTSLGGSLDSKLSFTGY